MKQKLYGVINNIKKLNGTINIVPTKPEVEGVITAGYWIPCFYGEKGLAVTPTTTNELIDVDNYILKDSSASILTVMAVMEGDEAWQTSTDS